MSQTNSGLNNGGRNTHYLITYDTTLSAADGVNRANSLLAACDPDFVLAQGWFGGINIPFSLPMAVQIATGNYASAGWPASGAPITLTPGNGTNLTIVRYLLVSELVEMFMKAKNNGWGYSDGDGNEGSKGEGLSRFLGVQFLLATGLGTVPPPLFGTTGIWLNGTRPNFVNSDPDDNSPDQATGCTTCFIYYLHSQLGYSISQIINAGASTMAGVYTNLTGRTDAWTAFSNLVNTHYPAGNVYHPLGDNLFPVSTLSAFWAPNQITCGYSGTTEIFIDKPAMAEVIITLHSADPAVLAVPATVTVPVGALSTTVTLTAPPIAGPFTPKSVTIQATYAETTLSMVAQVVPPAVVSVTLSPTSVVCGHNSEGTVTLNLPSLAGNVVVNLVSAAPGFATVLATATILQNHSSAQFTVTVPNQLVPFPTAHSTIYATYSGSSASAVLTITPSVIMGILQSLTLFPASVIGGEPSHGTVTLEGPVSTPTVVGLVATSGGVALPTPGNQTTAASVPPSVTVPAGATTALFNITTRRLTAPTTHQSATIMASAVMEKYALLTITS